MLLLGPDATDCQNRQHSGTLKMPRAKRGVTVINRSTAEIKAGLPKRKSSKRKSRKSSKRKSAPRRPAPPKHLRKSAKKYRRMNLDKTPDPICPHCTKPLMCEGVMSMLHEAGCDYKTTYDNGYGYKAVYCGHCGAVLGTFSTAQAKPSKK